MLADIHVHSSYSADSDTPMETQVLAAIREGLSVICFTDHIDDDYPVDDLDFHFDLDAYQKEIASLKARYAKQIKILMGVELGMQEHLGPAYRELVASHPFDFVIGSQHLVMGMDPWYPETFENRTDGEIYQAYFEETLANVKAFHDFDAMGHLDYIVRYGKKRGMPYSYRTYADVIDEILKLLVRYNIALELNTCGLRRQLGHPNPHPDILRRYRELGGTLVTLGSDSHKDFSLGYAFKESCEILKNCGFTHVVYYEKRRPRFISLK